ncbi:MAG: lysophospholipase [Deltaproteobacteria bacterium]|nr:lysophospholipase [Deltaproteobacteria bacterium]
MVEGPFGDLAFRYFPARAPWLHLIISHGFSEHMGWWEHVALALQKKGVSAYLFDHYHHGKSPGTKGDLKDFSLLPAGLRQIVEQEVLPRTAPGAPIVVLGHSNGALAALFSVAAMEPGTVAGLVMSSPQLGLPENLERLGLFLSRTIFRYIPWVRLPLTTRPWRLTGDKSRWPRYFLDILRFRAITPRFFLSMVRAARKAHLSLNQLDIPVLMLSAGRELVVSPERSRIWFDHLSAPVKTFKDYPGLRHELFNETRWPEILDYVLKWCREQCTGELVAAQAVAPESTQAKG